MESRTASSRFAWPREAGARLRGVLKCRLQWRQIADNDQEQRAVVLWLPSVGSVHALERLMEGECRTSIPFNP